MSKLTVTSAPHIHEGRTSRSIMLDVVIALVPVMVASAIIFGHRAILVIATTTAACVLSEYFACRILKKPNSTNDLTAVITGILLALNLPVSIPLWMAAIGGCIAIVVIKQMFGGVGQNFVNPAIAGRIVLLLSFSSYMSNWSEPFFYSSGASDVMTSATTMVTDAVSSATPLAAMEAGGELPSLMNMFLGVRMGCLGETCALAIIIGGIYLLIRRVISPVIPVCFVGTTVLLTWLMGGDPLYHLMGGGLLLGSIFMATDYTTSPVTTKGKIIYGIGCGLITSVIRMYAALPEGVSYSILLMNILVPHIETLTAPKTFGYKGAE